MKAAYLTTSWDDGHPLDLRLAELLHKYGVPATFFIPQSNTLPLITPSEIRSLSQEFEIGGHTLTHADLSRIDDDTALREITLCKSVLEDITGTECQSFCFPKGHFRTKHITYVKDAGFRVARTVELMSVARPTCHDGVTILATTIQANPLSTVAIVRNVLKRVAARNAMTYIQHKKCGWAATAEALLDNVAQHGGVFHLWGHSWEIDESGEWDSLNRVLAAIAERKACFHYLSNGEFRSVP